MELAYKEWKTKVIRGLTKSQFRFGLARAGSLGNPRVDDFAIMEIAANPRCFA